MLRAVQNLEAGFVVRRYNCYRVWCKQLDKELQQFVRKEGFLSAEECYGAISKIIEEDKERHKAAVAAVLAQLKASADFRSLVTGARGGDGEAKDGGPGVVCFMFLPVSIEELVNMALQLGEYGTFSRMMRATAQGIKAERKAKADLRKLSGFLLGDRGGGSAEPKRAARLANQTPANSPVAKDGERGDRSWSPGASGAAAPAADAKPEAKPAQSGDAKTAPSAAAPAKAKGGVISVKSAPADKTLVDDAVGYALKRVIEVKTSQKGVKTYDLNADDGSDDGLDDFGALSADDAKDGGWSPEKNKVFVTRG